MALYDYVFEYASCFNVSYRVVWFMAAVWWKQGAWSSDVISLCMLAIMCLKPLHLLLRSSLAAHALSFKYIYMYIYIYIYVHHYRLGFVTLAVLLHSLGWDGNEGHVSCWNAFVDVEGSCAFDCTNFGLIDKFICCFELIDVVALSIVLAWNTRHIFIEYHLAYSKSSCRNSISVQSTSAIIQ